MPKQPRPMRCCRLRRDAKCSERLARPRQHRHCLAEQSAVLAPEETLRGQRPSAPGPHDALVGELAETDTFGFRDLVQQPIDGVGLRERGVRGRQFADARDDGRRAGNGTAFEFCVEGVRTQRVATGDPGPALTVSSGSVRRHQKGRQVRLHAFRGTPRGGVALP